MKKKDEKLENQEVEETQDTTETAVDEQQIQELKTQLEENTKKCEDYLDKLQRNAAEFENYKKRTAKEKESIYSDTVADVVAAFLPVVDNMERAIAASGKEDDGKSLQEGVEMVYRQLQGVMKNLGVEEIKCVGESFDPQLHNAVMHIEDEAQGENVVVEEFQKGYTIKDKVIRHSMVKVAN